MRTTLCLIFALSLTACGGSDAPKTPAAPAPEAPVKAEATPAATPKAKVVAKIPPNGDVPAGEIVFKTFCVACHQADGTGMNGALGADFVHDKTRLAKSDEVLLKSIADGVPDTAMPSWKAQLDETQRKNALAYIRATFGQ